MNKFKLCKLESLDFDLKTQTTEQGRRYLTPSGDAYPSVTTILSEYNKKAIQAWRQRVGAEEANKIEAKPKRCLFPFRLLVCLSI